MSSMARLRILTDADSRPDMEPTGGWTYEYNIPEIASLTIRMVEGIQPLIEYVSISLPDLDDAAPYSLLDRLPSASRGTANDAADPPSVLLGFQSATACRPLLAAILDERIFAKLPEAALTRFCIWPFVRLRYTVAEIRTAPRSVGEGESSVALTTAQRVEWVMRRCEDADFEVVDKRDDYMRELQDAARDAGEVRGARVEDVPAES